MSDSHDAWIRQVVNLDDRHDSVPDLNGVEVGQYWRNVHVANIQPVTAIHLAGLGAHAGHYESIMLGEDSFAGMGWTLWSLSQHFELVERQEPETILVDDGTGQMALGIEEWRRADEQPPWGSTDDSCWCRVNHTRPQEVTDGRLTG